MSIQMTQIDQSMDLELAIEQEEVRSLLQQGSLTMKNCGHLLKEGILTLRDTNSFINPSKPISTIPGGSSKNVGRHFQWLEEPLETRLACFLGSRISPCLLPLLLPILP